MSMVGSKSWHRRSRGGGHGGESWLVSYADMMTLLVGFFVILYTFSKIDEQKFSKFGEELAETFAGKAAQRKSDSDVGSVSETRKLRALQMLVAILNLGEDDNEAVRRIERMIGEAGGKDKAMATLSEQLKAELPDELKQLAPGEEGADKDIRIAIPNQLLFVSGTNQLTPAATKHLRSIAQELTVIDRLVEVEVIGHTDSAPTGKGGRYANNFELSSARAAAVAEALVQGGVAARSVKAAGKGASEPLFPETKDGRRLPENMAKNRRVEIVVKRTAEP